MRIVGFKAYGNVEPPENAAQVAEGMRALGRRVALQLEARVCAILRGERDPYHHPAGLVPYHPSIAIQQSQPADTPPEASMYTVVNNITEAPTKLGSDLVLKDAVEIPGRKFLVVADGGSLRLFDVDSANIVDINRDTIYTVIGAVITTSAV